MADIAFLGLGTMGSVMAKRLIEAGHTVHVWNRSAAAVHELVAHGAVAAASIDEALQAGIVISILANDAACESVFTAAVLATAPPDALHINMATVSVEAADRLAERHASASVAYVAAPVLGRPPVAAAGQLNIVAGGAEKDINRAQPFLDVLGKTTWRVGARPSTANLVKIGVNYNLIHTLQALGESINLVERGGVDGQTFVNILTDAAYTGSAYTGYGRAIAARDYNPSFTVALGLKDLRLTEQAAAGNGASLPTAAVLHELFDAALADPEIADRDWSAIAEITRSRSS
ncbi:3-hydroxyisobutyrate dehydrogenase-like beta-hydroxyacid dehydrogenase [Subtercola frigoramans]|uniref:3-hydroxyisobutyrate dehydrogenase-like beta-hydroxyacid dehydrogenase n=2 Tax=Subtercola frigoramans TaxID=120298 RepID=A0ABS2L0U2_9MICO|nr:3-hydroxyisobutyrate dehydrogenase-like beta-hydroxyacid dehydrogenase [Subtercola frigoramans]